MTRCSQCGWDFTFVQDYRAHYCQQAAAKQTTPQSPKEALPGKFPPRRWISARDCWTGDGRVNVTADAHHSKLKPDEVEYLSLTEHESALAEAVRKAREKGMIDGAREAGYQIMRSMANQDEAQKANNVCRWLADRWEAAKDSAAALAAAREEGKALAFEEAAKLAMQHGMTHGENCWNHENKSHAASSCWREIAEAIRAAASRAAKGGVE